MDLGFSLNLEQKQNLVMTPQLQMAIELLQFSSQELEEYVEEELKSNPLLERIEREVERQKTMPRDYSQDSEAEPAYENMAVYQPNLYEYLEGQLYQVLTDDEIEIGRYIIGNLDDRGYLAVDTEDICHKLNLSISEFENILRKIHYLDPTGIAARNLQECLQIQLDSLLLDTKLAEYLVKNYWTELKEQNFTRISQEVEDDEGKIKGAINLIKTLNPHPASSFHQEQVTYIQPDIIVKKVNGRFVIIPNENTSPVLRINPYYHKLLQQSTDSEAHEFLQKKYRAALWLIRSIEQRRVTIYRICEAIVKKQQDFFNKGIKYLTPMTMQEIAEMIDMHESTVSRATTDKYIQTPQGLYKMKFFFNRGVNNLSSVSIKAIIADYIKNEDPSSPLSDRQLAEKLSSEKGIDISRRTVAKYRKEAKIPSSTQRRAN